MDSFKQKIIVLLQENARYTVAEIAVMTGASEADVQKAVTELEDSGIILKYSTILDTELLEEGQGVLID